MKKIILILTAILTIQYFNFNYIHATNRVDIYFVESGNAKPMCVVEGLVVEYEPEIHDELLTTVEEPKVKPYTDKQVEMMANVMYGEARGLDDMHIAAVGWCVLNRVDAGYGTIEQVISAPHQFCGYKANRVYKDLDSYNRCKRIATDVLDRYFTEGQPGRVLPKDYLYFTGNGVENKYRKEFKSTAYWNWSLENPYK